MKAIIFVLAVGLITPVLLAQYNDAYQAGQTKMQTSKYAEARQDYEQALKLATNATERADAQIAIGLTYNAEQKYALARTEFEKVLAIQDAAPSKKVQAQMSAGRSLERDYAAKTVEANRAYNDAITAYSKVADITGASPEQKFEARMAVANMFMTNKNYTDASTELKEILLVPDISVGNRATAQLNLGKCLFNDRKYEAARNELTKIMALKELPDSSKAEAQLKIGLSYYAERDYAHAKTELGKILTMPNADRKQLHEAKLYLCLRNLIPENEKALPVLFIGASQTQVFDVPQIVEVLAASAPQGTPRIITDGFLRGGTGIQRFWEEGYGPGTARERISSEPWNCVVFETHPVYHGHEIFIKYGTKFTSIIRENHAKPIFFEAPAFMRHSYPADFQKIHDDTVALGKNLNVSVAPANYAWMKYLGPTPTPAQRMALYHPDAVHPSKQGAYMLACTIYSAITGLSPIGLTHAIPSFAPDGITPEEATALQKAAWEAYLDTKAAYEKK